MSSIKTIKQALRDEIPYPLGSGFFDNKLMARGIDPEAPVSPEIFTSDSFSGAIADCLYALVISPNVSEAGMSVSLTDRVALLRRANTLYKAIGEDVKEDNEPRVTVGW